MSNQIIKEERAKIEMSTMSGSKALMPNNIDEAYRLAQAFSRSNFIPQQYRGKPDEAFSAIVLGMEVGLPPMRSLQSIAVVNGTPCIYGDAQLALAKSSNKLILFKEYYEGEEFNDSFAAVCELQREGDSEPTIERFTVLDAKNAKLWGKSGTWTTHPKRMLRYKARAFALRDKFADVLLGLTHSVEEMQGEPNLDRQPRDVTPEKTIDIKDVFNVPDQSEDVLSSMSEQEIEEKLNEPVIHEEIND
jgi:hypothetical protein